MQSAKDCLRRHYLQYEWGGVGLTRERQSEPLRFGSMFHYGLDLLAQGMDAQAVCAQIQSRYGDISPWIQTPEDESNWWLECEKVMRLLLGYQWYWSSTAIEIVATEQTFDIPLLNPDSGKGSMNWDLRGKMDKIARIDGRLMLMEHKTTGEPIDDDSDYWARLRIDSQISLYLLAARAKGFPVQGVLYDVIGKPRTSLRNPLYQMSKEDKDRLTNDGIYFGETFDPDMVAVAIEQKKETVAMYGARLAWDITATPADYYVRKEIPRLDSDLDELRKELWGIQKRLSFCKQHGFWDKNTNACRWPYPCEMIDICYGGYDVSEGASIPPGYKLKSSQHPELEEENHGNDIQTVAPTAPAITETSAGQCPANCACHNGAGD
jgi:hypothetical protein